MWDMNFVLTGCTVSRDMKIIVQLKLVFKINVDDVGSRANHGAHPGSLIDLTTV